MRASRPSAEQLLVTPDALLTRTDLLSLGLSRRAADAIFKQLPVVVIPGFDRPMIRAEDYRELIENCTYRDGERVRP